MSPLLFPSPLSVSTMPREVPLLLLLLPPFPSAWHNEAYTLLLFSSPLRIILMLKRHASRERLSQKQRRREEETRHTKHTCRNLFQNYTRVFLRRVSPPTLSQEEVFSQKAEVWAWVRVPRIH